MKTVVLWFGLLMGLASPLMAQGSLTQAEAAYANGDFVAARDAYLQTVKELSQKGRMNGHLLYNLGNCYFRLGDPARALLNYRRAQLFLPNDRDLAANIEMVADKMKIVNDNNHGWLTQTFFWLRFLSFRNNAWWVFTLVLVLGVGQTCRRWLRAPIWSAALMALALLTALMTAGWVVQALELRQARGMVMGSTVDVRSGKGDDFVPITTLTQGAEFRILERGTDWWKLSLQLRQAGQDSEWLKGYAKAEGLAQIGSWSLVRGKELNFLSD